MKIEFIYYSHILFFRKNGKRTQEFDTLDNTMLKPHKGFFKMYLKIFLASGSKTLNYLCGRMSAPEIAP